MANQEAVFLRCWSQNHTKVGATLALDRGTHTDAYNISWDVHESVEDSQSL